MKAVVVIPAYNEEENIGKLLDILFSSVFPNIKAWKIGVVVVDGHSHDRTREIVAARMKQYPDLRLISQPRRNGIGGAYMEGFAFAVNELKSDAVIEFDADFQHPPESIGRLLEKIDEGYDYVLGSRNIKGGGETADRNKMRSLLTRLGGFVARVILFFPGENFHKVTDPTTGLRVTRVKGCLDKVNLNPGSLFDRGFAYKIQLLHEIVLNDAEYGEIPLLFGNRLAGKSKMNLATVWNILAVCLKCRMRGGKRKFKI